MISSIILFLRPWFWLPATASMSAGFLAANGKFELSTAWLLALLTIGPGISAFAETVNDLCDRDSDSASSPKRFLGIPLSGGSGVPQGGQLTSRAMTSIALLSGVLSFATSLAISPVVLILTSLGLVLALSYSMPPIRLKKRGGLGLVAHILGYGPVSYYIGYFASMRFLTTVPTSSVLHAFLVGCWIGIVGLTADLLDIPDDSKSNIRTLAVRLGRRGTTILIVATAWLLFFMAMVASDGIIHKYYVTIVFGFGLLIYSIFLIIFIRKSCPPWLHVCTLVLECSYPLMWV